MFRLVILIGLAALASALPGAVRAGDWTLETVENAYSSFQVYSPSIAVDPSGVPHVTYWGPYLGFRYASRTGASWNIESIQASVPLAAGARPASAQLVNVWTTSLAIDAQGHPHVAVSNSNFDSYQIDYWSRDAQGWSKETPGTVYGGFPCLALDSQGEPRIAARMRYAFAPELLTRDAGIWSVDALSGLGNSYALSLAIDAQDRPQVACSASGLLGHLWRDAGQWRSEVVDSTSPGACSIAAGPGGVLGIAYIVYSPAQLRYAERGPAGWTIETVAWGNPKMLSLACDRHGEPRIAFYDDDTHTLRYASRHAGAWAVATVDSGAYFGDLDLALDAQGVPHIAYDDYGLDRIRYARGVSTTDVSPVAPALRPALALAPNPARVGGALSLTLALPAPDWAAFEVYDLSGRRVAVRPLEWLGAGRATRTWDPGLGRPGLYMVRWWTGSGATGASRLAVLR